MSSSKHHDSDLDPVLRYAPPRARAQGQPPRHSAAPPVDQASPLRSVKGAELSGDRAIVRQRFVLEPERVRTLTLRASGVLGVAALLAGLIVSAPGLAQLGRYVASAAFPRILTSSNSQTSVPQSTVMAKSPDVSSSVVTKAPLELLNRTVAMAEPPVPTREATMAERRSAPDFVVSRQLDRDELVSMLRRADEFIKTGDLSSARLLLRRAAEAGDAQAALALAGTFDPSVRALGLQDGAADIAMARLWYERAEQFGSSEAPRRIRDLAINSVK